MSGAPKVLIVEDEALIALELRDRLEGLGYQVSGVFARGEAALAAEASERSDLALMDMNLAGEMDGIETARRLRESGDPAVVFLTAYSDPKMVRRAMEADAHGFLTKPLRERELEVTLSLALKRRALERALREANDRLEERVRERTAALRQARDEAERANAAKSEFLSRASHELRTPLTSILGFSQLLDLPAVPPLGEEQRDHVREIRQAGKHLLNLVDQMLDLARVEAGHLEVHAEPLSLVPILEECAVEIGPAAARRGIEVTLRRGVPATVLADRVMLKQVLHHLLSNAVKYNRVGGPIQVDCAVVGGRGVRVSVIDGGCGLSAKQQLRLFKAFERLESPYEGIQGMGIGLCLTKKLVEAMGGDIGVVSEPGVGSTFWFDLPEATTALPDHE